ncbi:MAG: carboxypeptidase regulatory-like domain-containing protein, partial [Phycisphaerae bacterium]|nr:carboxypeptidase regulatory-like domain-containing protein [Phycisphaerae bacterium]
MEKNTVARIRLVSLLSACFGSVLFLASCSAGQGKGLVACWKFEEGKGDKLLDSSGHGNHGTIHGAMWTKGRVGGGLRFDGVDDYVTVPKSTSLNSISKEITLTCWIKTPLAGRYTILERWPCDHSNQRCLALDADSEGKLVHFALSPTGVTGTWHSFTDIIPVNKWVHIAATFNGKVMRIYVNGRPDPSPSVLENPLIHPSTADLSIGAWKSGDKWGGFFKGSMDEIKVYSRALTHKEILENYKAGSPIGTVAGRITDANGNPIEAAKVSVGPFVVTTDKQGRYRIAVPAKPYDVKASRKGYRVGARPNTKVKEGQVAEADIELAEDKVPPVLSELKVKGVDGVNATVVWKTNEACSSRVKYGTSSRKYDKTLESLSYVKTHRLNLTALVPGTKYYFAVESTDEARNTTVGKERTFSTLKIEHPRLIFRKSDLPALRRRAAKTPWKEMKVDAIAYIKSHTYKYNPAKQGDTYIRNRYSSMAGIASTGALAYILDPANKKYYKDKIAGALSDWDKLFVDARDWKGNNGQYWLNYDWCSAYAHSVLALDVIHDDLTASRRADLETKLGRVADWYYAHRSTGTYSFSAYGYWALYRNDRGRIDSAKIGWWEGVMDTMTPCGVYDIGPGYASAGVSYRVTKWDFHHLLQFSGQKTDFYSNRTLIGFYEWIYGASYSPFRKFISFGDSNPTRAEPPGITTYCASRFSKKAGGNAAWFIGGRLPPGRLMYYVLAEWPTPKPLKPLSHVWPDGCAAFWEDNPSDKSLMGALWSNTIGHNDGHAHHETNALHLCAYGENVLRNTGYCYFHKPYAHGSKGPPTVLGNVVLIDGAEHVRKDGGGITEAFTAPRFDYASGYSKDALPNGKHRRNFCFVHPQDGRCGYWVVFDEVNAD